MERIKQIDSIRAFSCIAIALLHVVGGWVGQDWETKLSGFRLILDGVVVQLLVRWAVPCFVMISGRLLLDPDREMPLDKVIVHFKRMIYVLLTFGLGYCFIESILDKGISNPIWILEGFKNLIYGESWSHMWFIYMIAGLYLLLPLLRPFVEKLDRKTARFILAVLFLFTIVFPTINKIIGTKIETLIPINTCYLFYFLAGYYLPEFINKRKAVFIICLGSVTFMLSLVLKLYGYNISVDSDSVFVAIYAMGIYTYGISSARLEKLSENKLIGFISKYSFGIYIIHPVFLNGLNKGLKVFPDSFPPILGEGLFCAVSLAGGAFATWMMCRIKMFRRILL